MNVVPLKRVPIPPSLVNMEGAQGTVICTVKPILCVDFVL